MATVLLVEDDRDMLDVTAYALRQDGFHVIPATDGAQALSRWQADAPQLVLLDVSLPRMSGFEVCRRIRERSRTPVILLTGRAEEDQVIQGFRLGADDYVTKPFSYKQLALRIRAVLARTEHRPAQEPSPVIQGAGMTLDTEAHALTLPDSAAPIHLTPMQFRVLELLVLNAGHVVTNARLVEHAWGYGEADASVLKTHISQLRRKLGQQAVIRSLPTVGYVLQAAPQVGASPPEQRAA
jgi:DNA-binding response OmpR family regulator